MLMHYIVLLQGTNVKLLLKDGFNQSDFIGGHEPLELHLTSIFVSKCLVFVLQLYSNLLALCLSIQHFVIKVDKDHSFLQRLLNVFEHFHLKLQTFH